MTLTAELIGKKYFKGKVEVTDPCYDKDVWCRMTTDDVKAGNYNCIIWRGNSRIGIIGIYLDGKIPSQKTMEKIGTIGVDAGLAGFFMNKPDYSDKEWCEFCDSIKRGDAWTKVKDFSVAPVTETEVMMSMPTRKTAILRRLKSDFIKIFFEVS